MTSRDSEVREAIETRHVRGRIGTQLPPDEEWPEGVFTTAMLDGEPVYGCVICGSREAIAGRAPWPCDAIRALDAHSSEAAPVVGLSEIALRLRAALVKVPYHRNPKIEAGQPFGYPIEGHREYSCPVCILLNEAEVVLGPFDFDSDPEYVLAARLKQTRTLGEGEG